MDNRPASSQGALRRATRGLVLCGIAGAFVLAGRPAAAHAPPLDAGQVVALSQHIVVATVTGAAPRWNVQRTKIVTDYTLAVERQLDGQLPSTTTITIAGGTVDGVTNTTCVTTTLLPGRRYLLFLGDLTRPVLSPLVGADQGFVAESAALVDGEPGIDNAASPVLAVAGGKAVSFRSLVDLVAAFVADARRNPIALPPRLIPHPERDQRLPCKVFVPNGSPAAAPHVSPLTAPPAASAPAVASAHTLRFDGPAPAQRTPRSERFSYDATAADPWVMNQFPPAFAPWAPNDQYQMSNWNFFAGDLFHVRATPTGGWGAHDGTNDMVGFMTEAELVAAYGLGWGPFMAVTDRWSSGSDMQETDVILNAGYTWTVDDEQATSPSDPAWGFNQTVLHELGHAWGLNHPWLTQNVYWDSAMNYAPKPDRFPVLFTDDTYAIRYRYGGVPRQDLGIMIYDTKDDPNSNSATYVANAPSPAVIAQGDPVGLASTFKIENSGTVDIPNPGVNLWLTPMHVDWTESVYLGTVVYPWVFPQTSITSAMVMPMLSTPPDVPPGKHYVAVAVAEAGDEYGANDASWTDRGVTLTVTSNDWWIAPTSFWQTFGGALAPTGSWRFKFYAYPWYAYDLSLCNVDGGHAVFSSKLTLRDAIGTVLREEMGNCGTNAKIQGWIPPSMGTYTADLSGAFAATSHGPFTLAYRKTADDSTVDLHIALDPQSGNVHLAWSGNQPFYDVERASRPDFSDGVVIASNWQGTSFDDPAPANGPSWYYRVR